MSGSVGTVAGDVLGDVLKAVRPVSDEVAMDQARARLAAELFDDSSEPATLGRFVLIEHIGRGGMGSVYGAHDPVLDRRVALKVLLPQLVDAPSRSQLEKEARSLAKLSHPNVVPVHDVVEVKGRVVLVMEYVAGATVEQWQRETRRSWRELVEVYAQIGEGLAAAHALGIIHRDVKPQNAIIGDDGRVRVVDFGLARPGHAAERAPDPASLSLDALTISSSAGGTPAYMSPEQLAGGQVGPASDQFSLCVALYRALYDQQPFAGTTFDELRDSVIGGAVRTPPRDRAVPRWVQAAVLRGLARTPDERHPSMADLCARLRRDPRRRRRRIAAVCGALAAATLGTWFLAGGREAGAEPCDAGPDRLAQVWSDARRSALGSSLAAAGPYGASIRGALFAAIDDYGRAFVTTYRSSCQAHQRGEESAALLDKRMDCLGRRLDALDGAIDSLLNVDTASVKHAREVVADLPAIKYCADTRAMMAAQPPPEDPDVRRQVEALRKRLSAIGSLERLRRLSEALSRAEAIAGEASRVGYPPLEAEANLTAGRVHLLRRDFEGSLSPLGRAEEIALEQGLDTIAVEATARRLYAEAALGHSIEGISGTLDLIEPLSRRLHDGSFARALLFNNMGVAYMSAGDPETARRYFERARLEVDAVEDPPTELQSIVKNLAMVTEDAGTREHLVARARQRAAKRLGESHPLVLELAVNYAHYVADPERALGVLAPACRRYGELHPDQPLVRLRCLYYQGFLETELGNSQQAARTLETAASLGPVTWDQDSEIWRDLARGSAELLSARPRQAIERFRAAQAALPSGPRPWWLDQIDGHARVGLGAAYLAVDQLEAAQRELELAASLFESFLAKNQDVENHQRLALARVLLGRVAREQGGRARATRLLEQAEDWYRSASASAYASRLSAIERWRRP